MTTVDDILTGVAAKREPKRNRWGQYVIPEQSTGTEVDYQRATSLARMLADTYNLDRWQRRMTVLGLAARPDLFAQVVAATPDERALLNEVCEQAAEAAGASVGRNIGSAMHRFAQRADAGETVTPPEPLDKDLTAYRAALVAAEVSPVEYMSERIVVVPSIQVAGTFDRILQSPRWAKPRIGDLKTAQEIWSFLEIAVQLACYAHGASIWDLDLEQHLPMPDVDQEIAIVMHAPAGKGVCTLYEVDIVAGWEAVQLAVQIRGLRKRKDFANELNPAVAVGSPDDGGLRAEHARQRLMGLADRNASIDWPTGVQTFKEVRLSRHIYTHDELNRIETALSHAEQAIELPFGDIPDAPAADPDTLARMVARLEVLPADLFARVAADAKKAHVPNLRTGRVQAKHLDVLEQLVDAAETEAAARAHSACGLLGEYGDDPSLSRLILGLAGCGDLSAVDDKTGPWISAICLALDDGLIASAFNEADGDEFLATTAKAEELIVRIGEGRAGGVKAAAAVAKAHGLPCHRSVALASADPLLCALIAQTQRVPA